MRNDLAAVIIRAAQRVPGPVAERSLAQLATVANRYPLPDVAIGDPAPTLGLLRVTASERWCLRCGETINESGMCPRCGGQRCRPAVEVLRPDEYYIAT